MPISLAFVRCSVIQPGRNMAGFHDPASTTVHQSALGVMDLLSRGQAVAPGYRRCGTVAVSGAAPNCLWGGARNRCIHASLPASLDAGPSQYSRNLLYLLRASHIRALCSSCCRAENMLSNAIQHDSNVSVTQTQAQSGQRGTEVYAKRWQRVHGPAPFTVRVPAHPRGLTVYPFYFATDVCFRTRLRKTRDNAVRFHAYVRNSASPWNQVLRILESSIGMADNAASPVLLVPVTANEPFKRSAAAHD